MDAFFGKKLTTECPREGAKAIPIPSTDQEEWRSAGLKTKKGEQIVFLINGAAGRARATLAADWLACWTTCMATAKERGLERERRHGKGVSIVVKKRPKIIKNEMVKYQKKAA